jgi:hypothetical protein
MRVKNWEMKEQSDTVEVSADVDGFRLWFRSPKSYPVSRTGDPFLASALLPAMRQGEKLEFDPRLPVSPKLLRNAFVLQEIFHSWNPEELRMIPVSAKTSPAEPLNTGAMSFFSGGVDSMYTFLKRKNELSHVVNIYGFDFFFNSGDASTFSVADLKDLAHFAWKLMLPVGPVSAYLKGMLSKTTLQTLSNYVDSGSDPGAVETSLVEDLNKIISGQLIYDRKRFAGVNLRPQTRHFMSRDLKGEDLSGLNRLLLEDAYPREISGKYNGAYQTAIERNTCFVQSFGKTLVPVENNHYAFGYRYNLSRNLTQGSALASVALLLGFPQVYVPSAYTYRQLCPLGSHPLTDGLWSNECVEIIHDGCEAGRTDKLKMICECESALTNLRVCFDNVNINCGKCAKCLRTMMPLKLLRASAAPFPTLPSLKVIRKSRISDDIETSFFKETVDLALQTGDQEMRYALCACMKRNELLKLLIDLDKVLLGGFIKRAYRRIVPGIGIRRIDTTPRD